MIGQWCTIDKNRFCQEIDCQRCQINYFGDGWTEYEPILDRTGMQSVASRQGKDFTATIIYELPIH